MAEVVRTSKGPDLEVFDSVGPLQAFARDHCPGRYDVDQHSLDPFPGSKVIARAWGNVIDHKDAQVVLDPIPWHPCSKR